ncbi:MAG: hypothetical protein NC400_11565 [Clostridium sp.]|nr:hypothetical protein [Clostridium sp.]
MEEKSWLKKNECGVIALAAAALLCVITACAFDFYYDLNDDVLMKDILAGVYTGTPEGHNIQMHWPVSAFISLLYRIAGGFPWYGYFLCFCHFGCFFLILRRSLSLCGTFWGRLVLAAAETLLFGGLFLGHLVFAQYTVTTTLIGGTAAFLFYTTDVRLGSGAFIKKNIPAVLLVSLAYVIRSEMLILVLPMICAAGVAKWGSEKKIFTREHAVKYFSVIGLILAGILLGQAVHTVAYGSKEWKKFTEFFDNRTELYDFQSPPDYEEHRAFYESIGLSESEKILFDNYNFGMDEEIDEVMVGKIAEYAGKNRNAKTPFLQKLPGKLKDYVYRFTHGREQPGSDYPWNYAVILGYILVFFTALPQKREEDGVETPTGGFLDGKASAFGGWGYVKNALGVGWKLAFLFAVRTALWMYILMRERAPERITHSLYLMELCILAGMLLVQWKDIKREETGKLWGLISLAGFGLLSAFMLPDSFRGAAQETARRAEVNAPYQELYGYLSGEENADNFYLIDVYSSVSYSEKMFAEVDNSLDNYDIMGGWACKSPLQKKKFALFGIDDMERALREKENVYFVRRNSEDMEWLSDYYESHGTPVEIKRTAVVAEVFEIYEVLGK